MILADGQIQQLQKGRQFIETNSMMPISLHEISNVAGFSPYHFIRLFSAYYRQTPYQYLKQCRIEHAKRLLQTSQQSIEQICFAVGYQSLGSFSTLFHQQVGLSPASYRSRCQLPQSPMIPLCYQVMRGMKPIE